MSTTRTIATPHGDARLEVHRASEPMATLLLTHGAGGGIEAPDLQVLAADLPRLGITVELLEMPWRVAGKKLAPRPTVLDECLMAVASALRPRTPRVVGGRSAGARAAARCAQALHAEGYLALAFPLHPPGKPEKLRDVLALRDLTVVGADDSGRLRVTGGSTQDVGHAAFEGGVELHELVAEPSRLERAFLELTEGGNA